MRIDSNLCEITFQLLLRLVFIANQWQADHNDQDACGKNFQIVDWET